MIPPINSSSSYYDGLEFLPYVLRLLTHRSDFSYAHMDLNRLVNVDYVAIMILCA